MEFGGSIQEQNRKKDNAFVMKCERVMALALCTFSHCPLTMY